MKDVIYNDKKSKFQKTLGVDKSVLIHNQYLQVLATEMYKGLRAIPEGLSPNVLANNFTSRNQSNYNLCHISCFKMPLVNSTYNWTEIIAFLDP